MARLSTRGRAHGLALRGGARPRHLAWWVGRAPARGAGRADEVGVGSLWVPVPARPLEVKQGPRSVVLDGRLAMMIRAAMRSAPHCRQPWLGCWLQRRPRQRPPVTFAVGETPGWVPDWDRRWTLDAHRRWPVLRMARLPSSAHRCVVCGSALECALPALAAPVCVARPDLRRGALRRPARPGSAPGVTVLRPRACPDCPLRLRLWLRLLRQPRPRPAPPPKSHECAVPSGRVPTLRWLVELRRAARRERQRARQAARSCRVSGC